MWAANRGIYYERIHIGRRQAGRYGSFANDEDLDMEWDSVARRWVPAGTNDESEEDQREKPESPRKPVAVAQEP
jgi:hypothetical protein